MKKFIALILCTALLCGCNNDTNEKTNSADDSAKTTAAMGKPVAGKDDVTEDLSENESEKAEIEESESDNYLPAVDENGFKRFDLETAISNLGYFDDQKVKISFLNPEQQKAFDEAYYVKLLLSVNGEYFWDGIGVTPDESMMVENAHFMRSGYSYDSVVSEFSSVLDEELLKEYENSAFSNADGEFAMTLGARGGDIFFDSIVFEPEPTKNDPDVIFKGIASYRDVDSGESLGTKEYIFRMEKTKDGWRFKEFSLWL